MFFNFTDLINNIINIIVNGSATKAIIWLVFLILAVSTFFGAKLAATHLSAITQRVNLKKVLAGGVILAFISALPELTVAIVSGLIGDPELSVSDVIGSNSVITAVLVLMNIIFFKKYFFSKVNYWNKVMLYLLIFFDFLLFMAIVLFANFNFMRWTIPIISLSWVNLVIMIAYIIFFTLFVIKGQTNTENNDFKINKKKATMKHLSMKQIYFIFSLGIILIIVSTFFLTFTIKIMESAKVYNIPSTSAGGILLGYVTGMPEITSIIFLARLGQGTMAISTALGANLFHYILISFLILLIIILVNMIELLIKKLMVIHLNENILPSL